MNKIALGVSLLALSAGSAFAQTCASPIVVPSNGTFPGDLCTATNTLPQYGGTTSPQAEIIYSFVAQNATGNVTLTQTGAPFGATMFLLPSPCAVGTDPISFGDSANPMPMSNLAGGGTPLVNGQTYFIVMTADPGGPADACGAFSFTTPTLPVELQNFSVD
jgi:hypothetical protein